MKLFCSAKLQRRLGRKYENAPTPEDPMDSWYANLITLHDEDAVLAVLPHCRFCVVVPDIREDQWGDLDRLLVQAIRETLHLSGYGIPQFAIDRYLPAGTVPERYSTRDRFFVSKMGAVTTKLLERVNSGRLMYEDPGAAQDAVNNQYLRSPGREDLLTPWQLVKQQLQQRYGKDIPAMELDISLNLQEYVARRTLIVPAESTFSELHGMLQLVFRWDEDNKNYSFLLGVPRKPRAPDLGDRLSANLRAGDLFQYRYRGWSVPVEVKRYIHKTVHQMPVCTVCQGRWPLEGVNGLKGYLAFRELLRSPDDEKRRRARDYAGRIWFQEDDKKKTTERLQRWFRF